MFDFHMHSKVSFDGRASALELAQTGAQKGLKEICFTDHMDFDPLASHHYMHFELEDYRAVYDSLEVPGITIRRGVEFGLLPDNTTFANQFLSRYPFDFVIGSAHFVQGYDPYFEGYWEGKTLEQAELTYLEGILDCVRVHDNFDVLGHLTYISKTRPNPVKRPMPYEVYREAADEILRILADKGKGMEVNTSGVNRSGDFLPPEAYLRRFRELGGELVTVGSDAHDAARVGEYCLEAARMVQEIFGYVCTFAGRKPLFHRV